MSFFLLLVFQWIMITNMALFLLQDFPLTKSFHKLNSLLIEVAVLSGTQLYVAENYYDCNLSNEKEIL